MNLSSGKSFFCTELENHAEINRLIHTRFFQLQDVADRQSHYFHGRFENIYINRKRIPEIERLVDIACVEAAKLLQCPATKLKVGFWFNLMDTGHITTAHNHDDEDELLSCVYYVSVPENSGDLVLHTPESKTIIKPEAGMLVYFHPQLVHEVTENLSDSRRLSIAINFGLKTNKTG